MANGGGLVLGVLLLLLAGAGAAAQDVGEYGDMLHGVASWSDDATSDKGACGYGPNVAATVPLSGLVTGFGRDDGNCGVCYRVICTHPACNTRGLWQVTVTDICRAQACERGADLFELSGSAFEQMAEEGRAQELRNAVIVPVRYKEDCAYSPDHEISFPGFRVDPTTTNQNFSVIIIYIEGEAAGNVVSVLFKHSGNPTWHAMTRTHGITWKSTDDKPVTGPVSFRVTMPRSGSGSNNPDPLVVTAEDVIPAKWGLGLTYFPPGVPLVARANK